MKHNAQTGSRLRGGEIYLFRDDENGCWCFAKVLAVSADRQVAYVRTYDRRFITPPQQVDVEQLTAAVVDDVDEPTMGCAPIVLRSIQTEWATSPLRLRAEVTQEEAESVEELIDFMRGSS